MWIPMEIMQHILIFFSKAQKKLAREQRKLSHCELGSNRYKKQKKKVARIHTHIAHQRKDFFA
ncbi:MAG: transposase [Clostridium sp.]